MYNIDGLIELLESKIEKTNDKRRPKLDDSNVDKLRTIEQLENVTKENDKIVTLLTKSDIIDIFECEDQKALKLMRLLQSMGYAIRIGREYYIQKSRLVDFLTEMEGRKVVL